jgi:hypothetical protein
MSLNHANVNQIRRAYTAIAGEFPKSLTAALADYDEITSVRIEVATTEQIADAIAACLLNETDPFDDPKVQRMAFGRALANPNGEPMTYAVGLSAERHVLAALNECVDAILADWGKAAATPGQQLADAYRILGDVDLTSSGTILHMGTKATRAWAEASDALDLLRVIDIGWHALAELTQFASTTNHQMLRWADLDLEQYETLWLLGRTNAPADPWAIVQAGGTIELANRTTFADRVERITEARVEQQASAEKTAVR